MTAYSTYSNQRLAEEAKEFHTQLKGNIFPRELAAEILRRVAEAGEIGSGVNEFHASLVGAAVARFVLNYDGEDKAFLRGFHSYRSR